MMTRDLSSLLRMLGEEVPSEHLSDPLAFIFADNFRCRVLCNVLDVVGSGTKVGAAALETWWAIRNGVEVIGTFVAAERRAYFDRECRRSSGSASKAKRGGAQMAGQCDAQPPGTLAARGFAIMITGSAATSSRVVQRAR
jgi:hypothetical protein